MTLTYKTQAGNLVLTIHDKKIVAATLNSVSLPLEILNTPHFLNLTISENLEEDKTYVVDATTIDGAPFTQAIRSLKSYINAKKQALLHVTAYNELFSFLPKTTIAQYFTATESESNLRQQLTIFLAKNKEDLCHL